MGFFSKVEPEIQKIEAIFQDDVHALFRKAKQEALDANAEVTQLKSDLQVALSKAANLHQAAIDAAKAAQAKAEQDVADLKAAIIAHTNDMNTQSSQIINKPAPVVDTAPPASPAQ